VSRAISVFLDGRLIVAVVVAVVVAALIAPRLARRLRLEPAACYVGVLSIAPIVAITLLVRSGGVSGGTVARSLTWWTESRQSIIDVARTEPGWLLNVILFVPAGLVWTVVIRRARRVLIALVVLSFLIETLQALFALGASDVTDLIANALGATIGVASGAAIRWRDPSWLPRSFERADPDAAHRSISARRVAAWLIATGALFGLCFGLVQVEVNRKQSNLRDELEAVFDGLTISDVNRIREPGLDGISPFFDLVSVRPNAYRFYDDDRPVEVRYPVDFLGAYRCVFVTFSKGAPVFRDDSGSNCTREDQVETEPAL
jgi:VanZ like protein